MQNWIKSMVDDFKHFTPFEDLMALVEFYEDSMTDEMPKLNPNQCYYCERPITELEDTGYARFKFITVCQKCLRQVHAETLPLLKEIFDER